MHETKSHEYNTWLTLTYSDENLPSRYNTGLIHPRTKQPIYSGSLDKSHVQKFVRKLRKHLERDYLQSKEEPTNGNARGSRGTQRKGRDINIPQGKKPELRYYYGGEYGEKYNRPHYHICLFGIDFNDKKLVRETEQEFKLYESETLQQFWKHGQAIIGELNWQTAAYTARYIMKKITGKNNKKHYERIDKDTGEIITLEPEFNDMSRRPGLGFKHYQKYKNDFYKAETSHVRVKGKKTKPPRYYDKLHKRTAPDHMAKLAKLRLSNARQQWRNHTPARLKAEEQITKAKIKTLRQKL